MSDEFQNAPGSNPGERSGSHARAVSTPPQQDWIAMNARSIIFALVGLLTGTMGVGGFTFAATNHEPNSPEVVKLTAEVARLSSNVAETNNKLVGITVTLAEMKAGFESGSREDKKRDEAIADHESRLRRLERPGR